MHLEKKCKQMIINALKFHSVRNNSLGRIMIFARRVHSVRNAPKFYNIQLPSGNA